MPRPQLLSTSDVAALLGVHVRTVHRWIDSGRLTPYAKAPGLRGAYLFTPNAVATFRARKAVAA